VIARAGYSCALTPPATDKLVAIAIATSNRSRPMKPSRFDSTASYRLLDRSAAAWASVSFPLPPASRISPDLGREACANVTWAQRIAGFTGAAASRHPLAAHVVSEVLAIRYEAF
jgi:hypothetical protein